MHTNRLFLLPLAAGLLLASCGFIGPDTPPKVVAHRGAAGNWPENSRTAILRSIEKGYAGIEFDLVLTKDLVPVLSHDPWVHETLCTTADGGKIEGQILIKDLTLEELQAGYLCGGVPDPTMPDAEVIADTHMTLDEILEAAKARPEMILHFDMKYEPEKTQPAEAFAKAIWDRWRAANLPNPWYVSSNWPELLKAFKAEGDVRTMFAWPHFQKSKNDVAVALGAEIGSTFGFESVVGLAEEIGADGVSIAYQVIDRHAVETAKSEGLTVIVWTLNDENALDTYCNWPVDILITDYPERAPCK